MRMRSLFIWLAAGSSVLVLTTIFAVMRLSQVGELLNQAQANRYQSYLLADMLRQSSDDLTRLARTYVVTGDAKYESQYWDILAIRNGEKPMPEAYYRIYWDFVAAGEAKPRPDGQKAPLLTLMKEAGFTDAEFAKLDEAKRNSDGLVRTETIAMNAVKGKFDDGKGGYTKAGDPDQEMARKLMHDASYHTEKAKIMRPVDAFYVLMEQRTNQAVTAAESARIQAKWLVGIAIALNLLGVIFGLAFAYRRLVSTLGGEPHAANQAVQKVAAGQLRVDLPSAPKGSLLDFLKHMQHSLRELIGRVQRDSLGLGDNAGNLAKLASVTLDSTHRQQQLTGKMATAVAGFAQGIDEIAREAAEASTESRRAGTLSADNRRAIEQAGQRVNQLAEQMQAANGHMDALGKASERVTAVVVVIKDVAEQTNLLALNAAIEAARAGESGRGFAVVADEVRKLAERTANSTHEIAKTLEEMRHGVKEVEGSVQRVISEIDGVVSGMSSAADSVGEAAAAAGETLRRVDTLSARLNEQQRTSVELTEHIDDLAAMATQTRSGMDTLESTARSLSQLATSLQVGAAQFAV